MAEITVSRVEGLTVIRLCRPEVRNAVNQELSHLLRLAVEEAVATASAIAIEGEGRGFCSGGDMLALADDDVALGVMEEMRATLRLLRDAPIPVAAFVAGTAVGGGAELAAAAHLLCAAPSARFGFIQRGVGLVPGWGGGVYLADRVGLGRAHELVLSARLIDAREAQAIGLVDAVLDGNDWERRHEILAGLDRPYAEAVSASLRRGAEEEAAARFAQLWRGEAHHAAMRRFLGGR